uniref:DNA repair metallo-beta-lactamase domain-containing protein n=1 Tax=Ananas comosus var. bracteatus TaxID=296719 RepID=A0A6V7NHW8_ANACO|nr:unnamed protein product [Ananas comosus var. bracteatus]
MPIEMPRGLPFSVDTWSAASERKRRHFLTHAHRDHLAGVAAHASYPVYASRITKTLALHYFPQLEDSLFVEIEVGDSVAIDDPDANFTVTAYDANHCPGAVMFLFEGEFGNILHTGDCRLTPDCLQNFPLKYIANRGKETASPLDYLFLDCTFGRCSLKFPSKQSAIQQVISCIWKHPHAPVVYLACDLLGQEEILAEVSRAFGSKIFVDEATNSECFQALSLAAPEILSRDSSSRFQVVGFSRLYEKASEKIAEAQSNLQPEPLFLRPSAQWYAASVSQNPKPNLAEAERDEFGVWHVCFSMHSSREELECALQFLRPEWVISTTPPCLAMELSYVKKHCYKTKLTPDDPLWKLFKLSPVKKSASKPVSKETPKTHDFSDQNESQLKDLPISPRELKNFELSPPCCAEPSVTLFGRARLGLEDDNAFIQEEKSKRFIANEETETELSHAQHVTLVEQAAANKSESSDTAAAVEELSSTGESTQVSSVGNSELTADESEFRKDMVFYGSSKGYNPSLRRLYRSMNVPVPRPLPSLVELLETSKRVKIGSGSNYSRLNSYYSLP